MTKKFILIIILMLCSIMGYTQYFWLNPLPQGNSLNSVCFVNENMGYAVGNYGTVLITNDAGKNWSCLIMNTVQNLNDIYFVDENLGFAVGNSGTILRTNDRGANWSTLQSGVNDNLYSVFFTDSLNGYSCGHNGVIIKTKNGGNQWDQCISNVSTKLFSVNFPSAEIGFIVGGEGTGGGNGFVLKTIDSGENWILLTDSLEESFYSTDFTDTLIGYAAGNFSYIVKTEDGGNSWISLDNQDNYNNLHIRSIKFINSQIGFTCDVYGNIMKTDNGGLSWINLNSNIDNALFSINTIKDSSICVVGSGGAIFVSSNLGNSFSNSQKGIGNNLSTINKIDDTHIFVVGDETIIKTIDGGENWETQITPELDGCISAHFINSLTGYALTYSGIYKTTDSGTSWTQVNKSSKAGWLSNIYMVNETLGFAVGGGNSPGGATWGTLLKTIDGSEWISQNSPSSSALIKTYFKNNTTGFLLGVHGQLFITHDAGSNWSNVTSGVSHDLIDMLFIDENTGFILGNSWWQGNIILKTLNGGLNWNVIYEDNNLHYNEFKTFCFNDSLNGFVVGSDGYIANTNDGGNSWITQKGFTNNTLNSILLVNDSSGYIIGSYGTFASFGNVVKGDNTIIDFLNNNAYPNPFYETIQFEIYSNINDEISIELFDINGRLVAKQNIIINQGKQIINFNPSTDLNTGTYIYKIKGSRIYNTGKIIKI